MKAMQPVCSTLLLLTLMQMKVYWRCYALASNYAKQGIASSATAHNRAEKFLSLKSNWSEQVQGGVSFYTMRGGAARIDSRLYATASSSPSASESSSEISMEKKVDSTIPSIAEKAKECLELAAPSSSYRSFGGIPYLDPPLQDSDKYRVLFVLGGPGAGKGTQSELLLKNYPCVHLSAGQLLREETTKPNSPHGAMIEECLVKGQIVPVEVSLSLLQNAMEQAVSGATGGKSLVFLVDGFPRNFDNLEGWTRCMKDVAIVWGTLVFQCPLEVLEERIIQRAKGSGRSDDNLESLRQRFQTFERDTVPVIDTLRLIGDETSHEVVDIRGDQTLDEVWSDTQQRMNKFLANDVLAANAKLLDAVASNNRDLYEGLCADDMFASDPVSDVMAYQEGDTATRDVCDATLEFISGTKASVSYDRAVGVNTVRETRIWSHQGAKGWRMVHFARSSK